MIRVTYAMPNERTDLCVCWNDFETFDDATEFIRNTSSLTSGLTLRDFTISIFENPDSEFDDRGAMPDKPDFDQNVKQFLCKLWKKRGY